MNWDKIKDAILTNGRFWLTVVSFSLTSLIAHHVIHGVAALNWAQSILDVFGMFGIVSTTLYQPPRKSLDEMTDKQRERLFRQYPAVRERWMAQLESRKRETK